MYRDFFLGGGGQFAIFVVQPLGGSRSCSPRYSRIFIHYLHVPYMYINYLVHGLGGEIPVHPPLYRVCECVCVCAVGGDLLIQSSSLWTRNCCISGEMWALSAALPLLDVVQ